MDKAKPGFSKFYRDYDKANRATARQELLAGLAGAAAAGVVGAVKGAGESVKIMADSDRKMQQGTPRDVAREIQKLGDKIDKL